MIYRAPRPLGRVNRVGGGTYVCREFCLHVGLYRVDPAWRWPRVAFYRGLRFRRLVVLGQGFVPAHRLCLYNRLVTRDLFISRAAFCLAVRAAHICDVCVRSGVPPFTAARLQLGCGSIRGRVGILSGRARR